MNRPDGALQKTLEAHENRIAAAEKRARDLLKVVETLEVKTVDALHDYQSEIERLRAECAELIAALRSLLEKIDSMTSEEFSRGGERVEREAARKLLAKLGSRLTGGPHD